MNLLESAGFSRSNPHYVVQQGKDCLELLNNLIRNNPSNQMLLKETMGFDPLISILKIRRGSTFNFTQQKTVSLLGALDTVELLLMGEPSSEPGKEANKIANQTALAQKNILDHLLLLGVESQWAPVALRCMALRCIGNLVLRNPQNLDSLARTQVGEEPHVQPALNAILSIILRASIAQEFVATDYVFKCFCEDSFLEVDSPVRAAMEIRDNAYSRSK